MMKAGREAGFLCPSMRKIIGLQIRVLWRCRFTCYDGTDSLILSNFHKNLRGIL